MMMWHVISNEVICVTVDVPGNGVESDKENMFGEEGEAKFELMSVAVTDYPEESSEKVNELSSSRGKGGSHGRKMQCSCGCGK